VLVVPEIGLSAVLSLVVRFEEASDVTRRPTQPLLLLGFIGWTWQRTSTLDTPYSVVGCTVTKLRHRWNLAGEKVQEDSRPHIPLLHLGDYSTRMRSV
jgi:hypothetical protein